MTSIFTAECIAINDAVDMSLNRNDLNFSILTDSLSVLQSLNKQEVNIRTNPFILQIKYKYLKYVKQSDGKLAIKFYWIPSHSGIDGNELADSLARDAHKNLEALERPNFPFTDLQEMYKSNMNSNKRISFLATSQTPENLL